MPGLPKETTTLSRDENEPPKGPQNTKERLYEKLRFIPVPVLDAVLILLGIATVALVIIGAIRGNAGA